MPRPPEPTELPFPAGQLETLVMRTLETDGRLHGYAIARGIERESGERFRVEEGSLYPALRRLEKRGDVKAAWGESGTGRRARFYELTGAGRKRLSAEKSAWAALAAVMGGMLGLDEGAKRASKRGMA